MIGRRLFWLRNALGLTQTSFADSIGITNQYVSKIESSKNSNVSLPLLTMMSTKLNSTTIWLEKGLGWSYFPSKPRNSIEFAKRQIEKFHVNDIIIVSYRDLSGGIPKGFIFRHPDYILSMNGQNTRSGYAGRGPDAYDEILNLLKESKITVGYVTPNESIKINQISDQTYETDFSETDISTLIPRAIYDPNILENEFKELSAGDYNKHMKYYNQLSSKEPEISLTPNESTLIYMIRKTKFDIFELMKFIDKTECKSRKLSQF